MKASMPVKKYQLKKEKHTHKYCLIKKDNVVHCQTTHIRTENTEFDANYLTLRRSKQYKKAENPH